MGTIKTTFSHIRSLNTRGFWIGLTTGLVYFSYIFWWFWAIYPLDSLGIENRLAAGIIILIIFSLCVFVMAIFWGVFGFLAEKFSKKIHLAILPLIIASLFTLTEYSRSIFFSIFWYGSGGAVGPYWPLGNIAYWFSDIQTISSTASFWGIYGITFLLAWAVTILAIFFTHKKTNIYFIGQILAVILIPVILNQIYRNNFIKVQVEDPLPISIIQTDIFSTALLTEDQLIEDLQKKLNLLKKAAKKTPEGIIVFPEGANLTNFISQLLDAPEIEKYFASLSKKNLLIIDSLRTYQDENFISKAALIDSKDGLIGSYDKQLLTPGGEFLPYIIKLPAILINPALRKEFKTYREYAKGSGSNIVSYKDNDIKILICSELISPAKMLENNGDFNIIIGSFSVWRGAGRTINQSLAMIRFRAIESGKYTVLASNFGPSYIIDPAGEVKRKNTDRGYKLLTGTIIPNKARTWYNYLGDWPILLISSAFFGIGIRKTRDEPKD